MHLAQLNIARMRAPLDSDEMFEFREFLAPINKLAEAQPGFVWRLADEEGDSATELEHPFGDDMLIVNLSVWEDAKSLRHFVYDTAHSYFVRSRSKWFERMDQPFVAMWPVAVGHIPSIQEAKSKLEQLTADGPSAEVFGVAEMMAQARS